MSYSLIIRAARFAKNVHAGQFSKFTGEPRIKHSSRVAGIVTMTEGSDMPGEITPTVVAAAWLHDVMEVGGTEYAQLRDKFGRSVAGLVEHMTHVPRGNYIERIKVSPWSAKVIKLADYLDNLQTLRVEEYEFTSRYLEYGILLMDAAGGTGAYHLEKDVWKYHKKKSDEYYRSAVPD